MGGAVAATSLRGGALRPCAIAAGAAAAVNRNPYAASRFLGASLWRTCGSSRAPPPTAHALSATVCLAGAGDRAPRREQSWLQGAWGTAGARGLREMSTKVTAGEVNGGSVEDNAVEDIELHHEARSSYLAYAMSVIVGRALPDARDGLKPVHRRILFAMHELGLSPGKPHRKSARVVGDVLGKYHPHGDSAVYDALVRMAQDFSMGEPLVNGHGNFGSIDADPPAAMRYTECRLQRLSTDMLLQDLGPETVDYVDNFDGSCREPSVMPSRLPNLLINGSSGIAVGMATNIPPHNLGEVVDGLCHLIRNPGATSQDLTKFVKGPDFPTGGQILDLKDMRAAYKGGSGACTVRGRAEIEDIGRGRHQVVITELPYQTNKAALVEQIADMVNARQLDGVSDIRDESDRQGMRVVIEIKRAANPNMVLNNLYKKTRLQIRFNANMTALVGSEPRRLSLLDFMQEFLTFRCDVVARRARHQLAKAQARDHLVQGYLLAIASMDEVVATIRRAEDGAAASKALGKEFGMSPEQADGVLGMALRRLTSLEAGKLEAEHAELEATVKGLTALLGDKAQVLGLVEAEALELKEKFGKGRRTEIMAGESGDIDMEDVVPNSDSIVIMSEKGYIKRIPADTFGAQRRGGKGRAGGRLREDDSMDRALFCRDHDTVLFFSEGGQVFSLKAYQVPEGTRTSAGVPLIQLVPLKPGEAVTAVLPVSDFSQVDGDQYLVMQTARGTVKRIQLEAFSNVRSSGLNAIALREGDRLGWVKQCGEGDSVVVASRGGFVIQFAASDLRPLGRSSMGVRAINLAAGGADESENVVVGMEVVPQKCPAAGMSGPWLLMVSEEGAGKRVALKQFRDQARGGKGVVGIKCAEGDGLAAMAVVGCKNPAPEEEALLASNAGTIIRSRVVDKRVLSRTARGNRLMNLKEGDRVRSLTIIAESKDDDAAAAAGGGGAPGGGKP